MPHNTTPTLTRCLVSSTGGRGPCEACGVVAELHLVEVYRLGGAPRRPLGLRGTRALCLPCSERPALQAA